MGDIYGAAASILDGAVKKEGSLKHLCYSSKYKNKKKLFALVFQTIRYKKLLEKVVADTAHVWEKEKTGMDDSLKLVLLYETVLGRRVPIQCRFHDILHEYHTSIVDIFARISQKYPNLLQETKKSDLVFPRYVRVNTIKLSTEEASKIFVNDGYQLVESKLPNQLSSSEFYVDDVVPDLLVFYSDTDLHSHRLYKEGKILLQDKASCLPAFVLNPPPHSFILDACAAPGNKSSHLASIIKNEGVVYSFDMDNNRFDVMNKLLCKANATCVKTILKDFLKVRHDSDLFSKAEYILVDPSCSGSGIVSRMDELVDDKVNEAKQSTRLKGLSGFQTAVLSHALSFPNVQKVVYSTCSVHKEENEDVVEKACKRFSSTFSLVNILPAWKNRGIGEWAEAYKCIRAIPEVDHTNGFFVALFERMSTVTSITENAAHKSFIGISKTGMNVKNNLIAEIRDGSESFVNNVSSKSKKTTAGKANKRKKENNFMNHKKPSLAPFSLHSQKKRRKDRVKKPVTS